MKKAEDIPVCERCGCKGNCECGHESLDEKNGCTLDAVMVCPCCNVIYNCTGQVEAICRIQRKECATIYSDGCGHYYDPHLHKDILNAGKEN